MNNQLTVTDTSFLQSDTLHRLSSLLSTSDDFLSYFNLLPLDKDKTIMKNNLPNITYYNDDHSKSPACTDAISLAMGATYTLPSTWQELTQEIENGSDMVVFHIDMIAKSGENIKDFINSLNTIVKFMPGTPALKILVLIKPTTTQQKIKELKKSGILGIGFDINYYPMEYATESCKALIANESHWPEHIINQLPNYSEHNKPLHVYFRTDWKNYFANFDKNWASDQVWKPKFCSTWDELSDVLKEEPHQLVFHISMVTNAGVTIHEFISMIETLIKLVCPNKKIPIAVAIDLTTSIAVIKELQKSNLHGIIPSALDFGINESLKGTDALYNRIPYWPKHILDQLPGAVKKVVKNTIELTPRQSQIEALISERGLSNKKIAQSLNITESTVKIHVSAILKAYGVRTRTQLVVMANK